MIFQTLMRRTAAALGAIAALTVSGFATAQGTISLSTGASCSYQSLSVQPNGNVVALCGSSSSPGTFTLTAPTSISTSAQTTASQVRVNRASGSVGAVDVGFTVSGTSNCSSAPATPSPVTFADGDTASKSILIDTNATTGSCIVTLLPPTAGGTLGSPSSRNMTVVDPDAPVTFAFATISSPASIGGSNVSIVVNRSGGTNNAWNVPVTLSGGLTANNALIAGTGTLSPAGSPAVLLFPANSSSATLTFDPADATPASPVLPSTLVLSFGTPTSATAPLAQTGTASGFHTLTLNGPAVGCPVPETTARLLGGGGALTTLRLNSGQVGTFALPLPMLNRASGIFKLSETTVSWPITPWNYEIHINKCKGLVQPSSTDKCYAISGNKTLFSKVWFMKLSAAPFDSAAGIAARNYCYAPASEGPWYVNIRYNYGSCTTAPCGWHAQWQTFSY